MECHAGYLIRINLFYIISIVIFWGNSMFKFILLSIGLTIQWMHGNYLGVEDEEDEVVLVKISCAPAFLPSPTVLVWTVLT